MNHDTAVACVPKKMYDCNVGTSTMTWYVMIATSTYPIISCPRVAFVFIMGQLNALTVPCWKKICWIEAIESNFLCTTPSGDLVTLLELPNT